jgi:predicted house-cleaning noncanonical NTP pyrophosphatase (MazG superfamily)
MGKRLVRDKALDNWVVPGAEHQVRPVHNRIEHGDLLRAKLIEECGEVILSDGREELVKELADVLSVCQAFANVNGVKWGEVLERQILRDNESGGFFKGMVWETSR